MKNTNSTFQTTFTQAQTTNNNTTAWQKVLTHPDFPKAELTLRLTALNQAATCYFRHYQQNNGDLTHLNHAITHWQTALNDCSPKVPDFPRYAHNLSTALRERYLYNHNFTDLQQAIASCKQALPTTVADSPYLPNLLQTLGILLRDRYTQTQKVDDLKSAIDAYQQAVACLSPKSSTTYRLFYNLGMALDDLHANTHQLEDIQQAIEAYEHALHYLPDDSPDLRHLFWNLSFAYRERYTQTDTIADLQTAMETYAQAIQYAPPDSPHFAQFFSDLGLGFYELYLRTKKIEDLQKAITAYEQAVQHTMAGSPELPSLIDQLSSFMARRYTHTGNFEDLQQSITIIEQALQTFPEQAALLDILGTQLRKRYQHTGNVADLHRAIAVSEQALQNTSVEDSKLPKFLHNAGLSLRKHYKQTKPKQLADLHQAINYYQQAIQLISPTSQNLPMFFTNLAFALRDVYANTSTTADLQQAIQAFEQAAKTGLEVAVQDGLLAARDWMGWAFSRQAWTEVSRAYNYLHQANARLLPVQLVREDKETWLKEIQGIAAHAAYALAKQNQLQAAVVTLESGLARLLSEALDRTDLAQLQITHPDLYHRYQQAISKWQQAEPSIETLRAVRAELDKVIAAIRQIPDYADFLSEPSFENIQTAAQKTPLIYILATEAGGLALLVSTPPLTLTPLWLPQLTDAALKKRLMGELQKKDELGGYLGAYLDWRDEKNATTRAAWFSALDETTHWLWQTVMSPLLDLLPPHITIIPVGLLGLLPLSAAWTTDSSTPTGRRYVLDSLTIAYAPNARALLAAQTVAEQVKAEQLLAVEQPLPVQAEPLPNAMYELQMVMTTFPQCRHIRHEAATHDTILAAVQDCTVLHCKRLSPVEALRQAQRWVRDSTYGDMLTYCDQMVNDRIFYKHFRREIGFAGMDERGFEHPFYWGAFGFVGI